jgi:hypothetical protein
VQCQFLLAYKLQRDNMATYKFTTPSGVPVEITGPPGFTQEQAQLVFNQQLETGALVGAKPGFLLSAETQAKQGLASAKALLSQAQSGIGNAFGSLQSALGQAGGAQLGSLANTVPGLSGVVGAAAAAGALLTKATSGASASAAIGTVNKAIAETPLTNPVNIADFAKQTPALTSIAPLNQSEVTGVLSQAKKLVDQPPNLLTNEKGLGSFGLDATQLEKVGVLKPGMSKSVTSGLASLKDLLKSPAAFTGKDGIKSADDLLKNAPKQELIQQDLMKQGLDTLKAQGIPAAALSPQGAAGAALNAAKDPTQASNFLKGIPVVGAGLAAAFTATTRDGAFATTFVKEKIPAIFKAEVTPAPAGDTVDRATVNAASDRVVGNPKVPVPDYGPSKPEPGTDERQSAEITEKAQGVAGIIEKAIGAFADLESNVNVLEMLPSVTDDQLDAVNAQRDAARATINSNLTQLNDFVNTYDTALEEVRQRYRAVNNVIRSAINNLREQSVSLKSRIAELSKKREGPAPTA